MSNRRIASLVAVVCCLGASSCNRKSEVLPPQPKEVAKLGQLVGKWKKTSHSLASSINGQARDSEAVYLCQWTLEKFYVTCTLVGEVDGKPVREVDVFGYSDQAKLYTNLIFLTVGSDAPQVYTKFFEWDGDKWRFLPQDGIRSTWDFKDLDHHVTHTERSRDGVTWSETTSSEHVRVY